MEELNTLLNEVINLLNAFENNLFFNVQEKYITVKSTIDEYKKHLKLIKQVISNDKYQDLYEKAKLDLLDIKESIVNANAIFENKSDDVEFSEDEINELLNALDEEKLETIYPTQDIDDSIATSLLNDLTFEN